MDTGRDGHGRLVRRVERVTEVPMLVLAVLYLIALILSYLSGVSEEVRDGARVVQSLIIVVFAGELIAKIAVADQRLKYLRSHWLDVMIVVLPFLRPLTLLLVLPVFARAMVGLNRVMGSYRGAYVLVIGLLTVFTAAGLMAVFEQGEGGPIRNFSDALWWATTTITTVGYGDTYPVTPEGRAVAVVLMVVGIALFGVLTASVAAYLVESAAEDEQEEQEDAMERVLQKLEAVERRLEELSERSGRGKE